MATTTHTATSKPTGPPMTDAPQALRAMTEAGTAQAKEAYGKVSAATAEATDLIRKSCSTAVEGARAYNDKLLAFAQANSKVAFDFSHKLLGVKSPSEFMQLSSEHARKQFEILTDQTKELAALAQQVTLVTTEPLKTGVTKAFTHAA
jgi:phasin